jgi:tetratricopeptide (TPR) repeat protein
MIRQAKQTMASALALAPTNRYVLRAAARLYLHYGDPERAVWLLRSSNATLRDPWLAAAETAISDLADRPAQSMRAKKAMLTSQRWTAFQLSELASALATREFRSGGTRAARKLFRLSLSDPTENSIAQAEWAAHVLKAISLDPEVLARSDSHEARASSSLLAGKPDEALAESWAWLASQPFSSRPAILGSYVAGVALDDHAEAERIARTGLVADAKHWLLLNNLAFSLVHQGRIDEAAKVVGQIHIATGDDFAAAVVTATRGLLSFRTGQADVGRRLYLEAIDAFRDRDAARGKALAAMFLAQEEINAGTDYAGPALERATTLARSLEAPEIHRFIEKLRRTLGPR